jgi:hypothetical protein
MSGPLGNLASVGRAPHAFVLDVSKIMRFWQDESAARLDCLNKGRYVSDPALLLAAFETAPHESDTYRTQEDQQGQ